MAGLDDPVTLDDFALGWPRLDAAEVDSPQFQLFIQLVCARIRTMLEAWADHAGQPLVVDAAGTGPTAAGASGLTAILFANKGVRGFKAGLLGVTAPVVLTDDGHGGAVLACKNTSPITITIAPTGDPLTGCSTGFTCKIRRCAESTAAVQVVFSGCVNRNPDGHTRIKAGRAAMLELDGTNAYLDGYTEA